MLPRANGGAWDRVALKTAASSMMSWNEQRIEGMKRRSVDSVLRAGM